MEEEQNWEEILRSLPAVQSSSTPEDRDQTRGFLTQVILDLREEGDFADFRYLRGPDAWVLRFTWRELPCPEGEAVRRVLEAHLGRHVDMLVCRAASVYCNFAFRVGTALKGHQSSKPRLRLYRQPDDGTEE